ncbi:MAG: type IV conjugative transfer system protein TraL [Anaerolineae bacterium]
MLSHPCPRTIDEPIRILGLDGEDWLVLGCLFIAVYAMLTALIGLAAAGLGAIVLRTAKRGRPPGALRQGLWELGVPLPGWPAAPPPEGQRYSPWR